MCACSINMNHFLFLWVLHEYQYYIQMNVNIMWELAYFYSRSRELCFFWVLNLWEVGSDSLTVHSLDHANDKRQQSREIQPTHWHMLKTVYMQLRTCFSSLFKCVRCSLVWSLTWCYKFDGNISNAHIVHQDFYNWLFKHLEAAGFY